MRLVVLESPYAGDIEQNVKYARACIRDCLMRNEAPIASHLLFTQPGVLLDDVPEERKLGIAAGHAWIPQAAALVVYEDHGVSPGMRIGIDIARGLNVRVEYRSLPSSMSVAEAFAGMPSDILSDVHSK